MGRHYPDPGQMHVYKVPHQLLVVGKVLPQLLQPGLSLFKGRNCRTDRKAVWFRNLIRIQGAIHLMPQNRVRHHRRCRLNPRNAKGLCRRDTGHAVVPAALGHGSKRHILIAGIRQIAVYFIGNHRHMMPGTQLPDSGQSIPVPDFAYRIMGIAQNHQAGLRFGQLPFQILKIHGILSSVIYQRTFQNIPSVITYGIKEHIIYRRLYQHIFPCRSQLPHRTGYNGKHSRGKEQPVPLHLKMMPAAPPALVCLIPVLRHHIVTEDAMLHSFPNRLPDLRGSFKIHIRHPHGQLPFRHIPLQGPRIPPVRHLIKIIHTHILLSDMPPPAAVPLMAAQTINEKTCRRSRHKQSVRKTLSKASLLACVFQCET